jgi:hypothetical protein
MAAAPRVEAGTELRLPLKAPMAVRVAPAITISVMSELLSFPPVASG